MEGRNMKVAILGSGSWGCALANVLSDNKHEVIIWGISLEQVSDINENHKNSIFFEETLNEDIKATLNIEDIKGSECVVLAVPSHAIEEVLATATNVLDKPAYFINVAKGFHPVTHKRLSVVIEEAIPSDKRKAIVSLIGPSHAEEVIKRLLTVVNAVSEDEDAAKVIQKLFSNEYFRVYRSTDVIGAEYGVAIKNIMAIASGILAGVGQGDNARAALITRGLAEMTRFGVAKGGELSTYLGLDGVGDLIVTCSSMHSRNFTAGLQIGLEGSADNFWKENKRTVEGVAACKVIYEEAKDMGIEMPITSAVYEVLYNNAKPQEIITELMMRKLKSEGEFVE